MWAFPPLLLAVAIMAFLGQGLENLILALVSQRWIAYCRVSRGQALSLRTREFVDAARSLGASHTRIILHHILPNLFPSAVVIGTFSMASAIISEAALSFLGLGVPPEIPTWGTMLADGRTYISTSWWLALFPGPVHLLHGARHQPARRRTARHPGSAAEAVGVGHRLTDWGSFDWRMSLRKTGSHFSGTCARRKVGAISP